MKKIFYMIVFLMLGTLGNLSAQITLFKGTFDEALKKAQQEKKDLFVDFFAEWCGPCKMMASEVFTQKEVGEFFNNRFICVQVDVDTQENKDIAKRYNVTALPTMVFISRVGKELRRVQGSVPAESLIKEAKIATGEELSFEQLYEKYKKKKNDLDVQQQLLIEAPAFIATQQGYNQQKWGTRIESLFPEYLKNKKIENMANEADCLVLTMYHRAASKEDPIFDYLAQNYQKFAKEIGKDNVARYLVSLNNTYIIQLCKKGDLNYKKRLERVNGDLKDVYSEFSFGNLSVQNALTLLADATYSLHRHDENTFFKKMDAYFAGKGDKTELNDYFQPLQDIAVVYEGKLSENAYRRCINWIAKALTFDNVGASNRTRLLMMMGDCLKNTGDNAKAKQSYNQAFLASAQIENKMEMQQLQQGIQQSLQGL